MTSISELFHRRRYRFTHRDAAVDLSEFDSSVADANSSSSLHHHTSIRRHNHHYSSQNNRREVDGCYPASRRFHRRRLDHPEHEAGYSESPSGSIINSDDFRRVRDSGSDRLPGSVLLARARLVERLRGSSVSVSGNRPNIPSSANNNPLEIRNERRNHSRGLPQDVLNCLQLEVFKNENENEKDDEMCTICVECFEDGDKVIRLNCKHTFHSCCLFPWARVCGACPNCRKPILVTIK